MTKPKWTVNFGPKARKAVSEKRNKKSLPDYVIGALKALTLEIERFGPTLGPNYRNWPHFSDLGKDKYHCHLTKSKDPGKHKGKKGADACYVACWEIEDKKVKIVEVYYVGTHENAPY